MTLVNSVLGPVDTQDLGFTLCHEHVVLWAGVTRLYPTLINRRDSLEGAVRRLQEAYAEGVRTILDVTPPELGRDIALMEEVSRRSGVHVIATTGTYVDIPRVIWHTTPDRIADLYVREIEEGMEGTSVRAGIIKVANNNRELEPKEVTVIRAAARAHKRTGVPITTHTDAHQRVGEAQLRVFEEEGVDPSRVCIGHSNESTDLDYLLGLLKRGVYLGMDHYPGVTAPPDWRERTQIVARLVQAGHGQRIMLSHDWGVRLPPDDSWGRTAEERAKVNPDGYLFIARRVLPYLRELGLSEEQVRALVVDNPRRFFEGV